jgi:hypothetical protein
MHCQYIMSIWSVHVSTCMLSTVSSTAPDFINCSSTTVSMLTCLTDSETVTLLYAEEDLADSDNSVLDS